jgi:uncharacterized oligopeptide transporter (OPT) family protein
MFIQPDLKVIIPTETHMINDKEIEAVKAAITVYVAKGDRINAAIAAITALDAIRPVNQEMLEALKQTYAYLWENKYPSVTTDISNDKAQALEWKKQQGVK